MRCWHDDDECKHVINERIEGLKERERERERESQFLRLVVLNCHEHCSIVFIQSSKQKTVFRRGTIALLPRGVSRKQTSREARRVARKSLEHQLRSHYSNIS